MSPSKSDQSTDQSFLEALKVVKPNQSVQGATSNHRARPIIICHTLDHFRAVFKAAKESDYGLVARSAPGAPSYAGIGFLTHCRLRAASEFPGAAVETVVDCADDATAVFGAMKMEWRNILFVGNIVVTEKLANICEQQAIQFYRQRDAAALDLEDTIDPLAACRSLVNQDRVTIIARDHKNTPCLSAGSAKGVEKMRVTTRVKKILAGYESDNPGTKGKLASILMHGRLGGSGHLVILPVDQGFEHGPARSFAPNPPAYDPHYHFKLAVDAGLSAYAAPLGMLEAGADSFAGAVPTILKMNSSNSHATTKDQAVYGSVRDALRLGCAAIGFTIYPAADHQFEMMEELRALSEEAKANGLAVVVWSYPRGGKLSKEGETAMDVAAYAAHLACLLGAHIVKVKLPTDHLEQPEAKKVYESQGVDLSTQASRVAHIVQSCFEGRRIVVFSGGAAKGLDGLYDDVRAVRDGGGNGSIIGRNTFQRPRDEALAMLDTIIRIYQGKA